MYDNQVGRWFNIDPKSELTYDWSTYRAFFNNPIKYIDPDGQTEGDFYDREGNYLGTDGVDDGKVYVLNKGKVPNKENTEVNWGGTLAEKHVKELKEKSTEAGAIIVQNRTKEGNDYTISEFKTVGGEKNVEGYTLEPGGPSTKTPNQDKRIPEGVYNLDNYSSAKHPDNFIIFNEDVSKDRKVLYHKGNFPSDTEACILPGSSAEKGSVQGSKDKMAELRKFIKAEGAKNVILIINNKIPIPKK
jgi:hypothetical protein